MTMGSVKGLVLEQPFEMPAGHLQETFSRQLYLKGPESQHKVRVRVEVLRMV